MLLGRVILKNKDKYLKRPITFMPKYHRQAIN